MAETAIRTELLEPFLAEQGLKDTNFFNGRLLTATDLVNVQAASRGRDRQLGVGIGAGVVQGLEVRLLNNGSDGKPPVLAVSKGLAFDRLGQAVALPQNIEVRLAKEKPVISNNGLTDFQACSTSGQNGEPLPGKGAYVFAARQATGFIGQAPRRGFGQAAKVEGCDRDLLREGVQFRLAPIDVNTLSKLPSATRTGLAQLLQAANASDIVGLQAQSKLRNWLAHACFGTEELAAWARDPFAFAADDFFGAAVRSPLDAYGIVDALTSQSLLDACDVPLALILWTQTGVKWADMWSVRRRPSTRPISASWPLPVGERRKVEAEAVFQQFQEQLIYLLAKLTPSQSLAAHATDLFRFLPPVGFLPVAQGAMRGFDPVAFVDLPHRDAEYIDAGTLPALFEQGQHFAPVDVTSDELIWIYQPWQNDKALDDGEAVRPYVILASGHMPHWATARLDVARWDYSQYVDSGEIISSAS